MIICNSNSFVIYIWKKNANSKNLRELDML